MCPFGCRQVGLCGAHGFMLESCSGQRCFLAQGDTEELGVAATRAKGAPLRGLAQMLSKRGAQIWGRVTAPHHLLRTELEGRMRPSLSPERVTSVFHLERSFLGFFEGASGALGGLRM